jgi:hypothetical protein
VSGLDREVDSTSFSKTSSSGGISKVNFSVSLP